MQLTPNPHSGAPPFRLQTSSAEAFTHPSWNAARERVLAAVARGASAAVLGVAGTGKTLLLQSLAEALEAEGKRVRLLAHEDAVPDGGDFDVLLADEGARLPEATLAGLCRLPVPFILAGLPGVAGGLAGCGRAVEIVKLEPLSPEQVARFIASRLSATGRKRDTFDADAVLALARQSGGLMRLVVVLASAALFFAEQEGAARVTAHHVAEAAAMREVLHDEDEPEEPSREPDPAVAGPVPAVETNPPVPAPVAEVAPEKPVAPRRSEFGQSDLGLSASGVPARALADSRQADRRLVSANAPTSRMPALAGAACGIAGLVVAVVAGWSLAGGPSPRQPSPRPAPARVAQAPAPATPPQAAAQPAPAPTPPQVEAKATPAAPPVPPPPQAAPQPAPTPSAPQVEAKAAPVAPPVPPPAQAAPQPAPAPRPPQVEAKAAPVAPPAPPPSQAAPQPAPAPLPPQVEAKAEPVSRPAQPPTPPASRAAELSPSTGLAFRGPIMNETLGQGGQLALALRTQGAGPVTAYFHAYAGLIGTGELTGTISPDGKLSLSGRLMMGRNPFDCSLTGTLSGDRLTGSATFVRPGTGSNARSSFTLSRT